MEHAQIKRVRNLKKARKNKTITYFHTPTSGKRKFFFHTYMRTGCEQKQNGG